MNSLREQLALICIFLLIYSVAHEYSPVGWQAASKWIKTTMDPEVDPCEDFVKFTCGKWNESYGDRNDTNAEDKRVNKELEVTIASALAKIDIENANTVEYKKSMKIFYDQCKNRPRVEGIENNLPLLEDIYVNLAGYLLPHIVEKIGDQERYPWENNTGGQFWQFTGTMQRVLGTSFLVVAEVLPVDIDCSNVPVLHLRPSSVPQKMDDKLLDFILSFVARYHNQSFDEKDVNDTKQTLLEFQTDFISLLYSIPSFWGDIIYDPKQIRSLKYNELYIEYPSIDWTALFHGLLPDDVRETYINTNPTINLEYQEYFKNIATLIDKHGHLAATNYGFIVALIAYAEFFIMGRMKSTDRRDISVELFKNDPCLDITVRYFSPSVLRLLCEEYKIDVDDWRNDILLLKNLIFSAFRFLIYSMDWISAEEKMLLIEKVNNIRFYGDIPAWIVDDNQVNSKTPKYNLHQSLVANDIFAQKKLFRQQMKPLITGKMDDAPPNFWLNAWNDARGASSIRFLIGIQLPPLYAYTYPLAVKFGLVGTIMGHELMHSFGTLLYQHLMKEPSINSFYAPDLLPLENSSFSLLKSKLECLIPYYNSYCLTESELFVDNKPSENCTIGNSTVEENNADTEGLKIAYTAYKFATQTLGTEPLLNDLTQITADQLFFMAYAKWFCGVGTAMAFDPHDPHSSLKARVEQPLMNFPPFAKAFGCHDGQRYSRKEVCSVYGNIFH